jgi:hypothetical protein
MLEIIPLIKRQFYCLESIDQHVFEIVIHCMVRLMIHA